MTLPNFIGMINQFGHAISETDIDDHGNTVRRNQYKATLFNVLTHFITNHLFSHFA